MRKCNICGTLLNGDDEFCFVCGTVCDAEESGSLQDSDIEKQELNENAIEKIEKQVINYYNDRYLGAEKNGNYVVLHDDTTVMGDVCNVVVKYQENENSAYVPVADVSVYMTTGDITVHSRTVKTEQTEKSTKYITICIIAILLVLNIILIPFISDKNGLIVGKDERVHSHSFGDMIDDLTNDYTKGDEFRIDILYYIVGSIFALFILLGALGKSSGVCTFASWLGIAALVYLFYEIYLTEGWSIGLSDAHLTIGFYLSCVGFISTLIILQCKEPE